MKICTRCGEEKGLEGFYNKKNGKFGKHAECQDCIRQRTKEWMEKYPSKKKLRRMELDRIRRLQIKEMAEEAMEIGQTTLDAKKLERYKRYCALKIKAQARIFLNGAIQNGLIIKPLICEECGKDGIIHGHHDDYGDPLTVRWLCPACHGKIERKRW